ncbi:MAG: 4Fe-4S dicluster domain-containing protein [Lentisphaerae bacterium]|nr:4Fe-4S dicluster domain-containing protein [Lentisphaerota bacterium]MBQ4329391.1 4Fe-4S binding protein [Lentisphaeria bacterium]
MAANVNQETCVGCGACVDSCPVNAIKIEADKAVVAEGECIECGACVGSCPTEAISL